MITTAPTPNLLTFTVEETRPTLELKPPYFFPRIGRFPQAKEIIGVDCTILSHSRFLDYFNYEVAVSFWKAVAKRKELLGEDKDLVVNEGMKLVNYLSTMNYRKVRVEILPEDSIIFRLDIEPGLQIVITKFYFDKDTCDGSPLISIVQDKEIIFHKRVPIETFVEKVRLILS